MKDDQLDPPTYVTDILHLYDEVSDLNKEIFLLKKRIDKITRVWTWVGVGGYFVVSIWAMWHFAWLIAF